MAELTVFRQLKKMNKAAFIMYYLGGGGGGEDFINQYSIFSYPSAQFPKNFVSPREDESDFVIPPFTRI